MLQKPGPSRLVGGVIAALLLFSGGCAASRSFDGGGWSGGVLGLPAVAPPAPGAPADAAAPKGGVAESRNAAPAAAPAPGGAAVSNAPQAEDRMIVYNANLSLAVQNVSDSVQAVRGLTDGVGGMVAGSATRQEKDKEVATLTLRVPSSAYNQVMAGLRKLSVKVLNENGTSRDVTEEFADVDAQMRNLQVTEAQFQELMKRAVTIDDILKVQTQLTQTRSQIERLKGRMNVLQRTSDMATIVVTIITVEPGLLKDPVKGWDPARSVQEAWEQSLVLVSAVADGVLRAVVFSWWLVPVGLLVAALVALLRRQRPVGAAGKP
ncbi:MAG: DUF4349 domain-containing protein [Dehalococcoidia bacterium]|nr:DUF4349 domain-containing protein [Dehalococcoidia bacterium]